MATSSIIVAELGSNFPPLAEITEPFTELVWPEVSAPASCDTVTSRKDIPIIKAFIISPP
jgi:hypothetical protein